MENNLLSVSHTISHTNGQPYNQLILTSAIFTKVYIQYLTLINGNT